MSLRGRYVIDRIKRVISGSFRLPVPPYGDPMYWDAAYRSFGPNDSYEWGDVSLQDIYQYEYQLLDLQALETQQQQQKSAGRRNISTTSTSTDTITTTFGETLGVYPTMKNEDVNDNHINLNMNVNLNVTEKDEEKQQQQEELQEEPILILGCGNSRFGEDMIRYGWKGPIIQTDISRKVIESMSIRCNEEYIATGKMKFIEDDATELSAFGGGGGSSSNMMGSGNNNSLLLSLHACFDKGLMDAIFCADEYNQCASILKSVHRVLQPGGIFCFLSFSRPEFLLTNIVQSEQYQMNHNRPVWDSVQVRQLSNILLYRFEKAKIKKGSNNNPSFQNKLKKQRQR